MKAARSNSEHAPRWRRAARVVGLLLAIAAAGTTTAAEPSDPRFDPARVEWRVAHLEARKLFQSMDVAIGVDHPEADEVAARLVTADDRALLPAPPTVAGLSFVTDGLGRRSDVELLVDPATGQVLQRVSHETGKRLRYRVYRFGEAGTLRRTWRPAGGEEAAGPAAWSDRSEEWFAAPAAVEGRPLTEPGTLIYLITISELTEPGDRFGLHAFSTSDETIYRIEAEVLEPDRVKFDYRLEAAGGSSTEKGRTDALRVAIRGRPLGGGDDGELTILGLRDVELLLDPATRVPLELRGRVAVFGGVSFRLERLEQRG